MELNRSYEIVSRLKAAKRERHLTIPMIQTLVHDSGHILSQTTIRRVFAKDSEFKRFSYEDTLLPLTQALGVTMSDNDDDQGMLALSSIEDMVNILRGKNDEIEKMKLASGEQSAKYEKRIRELEARVEFLVDQVRRKDELISKLMDRL